LEFEGGLLFPFYAIFSTIMESLLATRLKSLRLARGWTLDDFAARSGVSRAMISRVERNEASPTASILAQLAAGLSVTVASLFTDDAAPVSPVARAADQAAWRDPETGYLRRNVSPSAAQGSAEIVDVTFPAGARVMMDNAAGWHGITQQIWMLDGVMELQFSDRSVRLEAGDCYFMRLDAPFAFHNPGSTDARYAVVLSRPRT
jgi:transcriptional regulator with XRE-family HTH domain